MIFEEGHLKTTDGGSLYRASWKNRKPPKASILFVHGFSEHVGRYKNLVNYFSEKGYNLYGYDQRGHGRSGGLRGYVDRFETLTRDLKQVEEQVRREEKSPLFLLGHSFGGQVVLNYCLDNPDNFLGLIVSSPNIRIAFPVSPLKLLSAKTLNFILPWFSLPNDLNPENLSHDPTVVQAYLEDSFVLRKITVRLAIEILKNQELLVKRATLFRTPSLFLHAGADQICSTKATEEFFDKVPISDKMLKVYDGLYHEIFNEFEKETVFGDIERWIEQKINL